MMQPNNYRIDEAKYKSLLKYIRLSVTEKYEQETATAVDCGQVHLHGRYMGRNQRRGTPESQQGGNRPFCHKTVETERQSRSLLE